MGEVRGLAAQLSAKVSRGIMNDNDRTTAKLSNRQQMPIDGSRLARVSSARRLPASNWLRPNNTLILQAQLRLDTELPLKTDESTRTYPDRHPCRQNTTAIMV